MMLLHIQDKKTKKKKDIFISGAIIAAVYRRCLDNKYLCVFFLAVIVLH